MRKLILFVTIATAIFFQSCGHDSKSGKSGPTSLKHPNARFISTQIFSFTEPVNPSTLTEAQTVYLYSYPTTTRPDTYVISTADELTSFIQMTNTVGSDTYYQNMFSNLDTQTYLLIKGPACPDYYEYSGCQYSSPAILTEMNHFILDDVACPASFSDNYYVLKGLKK